MEKSDFDLIEQFDRLPNVAVIGKRTLKVLYGGISDRTIDRWTGDGILPRPRLIGGSRRWQVGDLRRALGASHE